MDPRLVETVSAPTNIAVIKYWGKASVALNTPINSSVSVTLSQDDLKAVTTVAASSEWTEDKLWLNGKEENISNKRVQTCLRAIRRLARDRVLDDGTVVVRKADWGKYGVRIASANSFPTAAGLASSAAGYAALVAALAKLFCVEEEYPGQLSTIARQGSGSACRSLYGGFVQWSMGSKQDGSDSSAVVVADAYHWPELKALICVVSDAKKDTSSTVGMSTSVETSLLLSYRAAAVVDPRLQKIKEAYLSRDFQTFGEITMQDSNQFHATCLDTYPPIFYMNDISKSIIKIVHAFNRYHKAVKAAYTFDAGPNAVIYALDDDLIDILACILVFYPANGAGYVSNAETMKRARARKRKLPKDLVETLARTGRTPKRGDVQKIYISKVGDGPRDLTGKECLLTSEGLPVRGYKPKMASDASSFTFTGIATTVSCALTSSTFLATMGILACAGAGFGAAVLSRKHWKNW